MERPKGNLHLTILSGHSTSSYRIRITVAFLKTMDQAGMRIKTMSTTKSELKYWTTHGKAIIAVYSLMGKPALVNHTA
jgi:hypothetical protein